MMLGCSDVQNDTSGPVRIITEDKALEILSNTEEIKKLTANKRHIVIRVDYKSDDGFVMYVGDIGPDFDYRIGSYLVKNNGSCYKNADPTMLEDDWVAIK